MNSDENSVVIRRPISATAEELFDAWIDPLGMREWMCPGEIVSAEVHLDARVGGQLLIIMRDAHNVFEHRGEFTIVDRPSKLAFTWSAAATDHRTTLVTVEFITINDAETELVLTHQRFPGKNVADRYLRGWGQIADRMQRYLLKP